MISNFTKKVIRLFKIIWTCDALWFKGLRYGVAAGIEHTAVLKRLSCKTVIDIGSSRGQFALAARHSCPDAFIVSFEPLQEAAVIFRRLFSADAAIDLHNSAIGQSSARAIMHVSGRDDSSSLLPISALQENLFPGTREVRTVEVGVAPLDAFLRRDDIIGPALLKLDVQGFELDALIGCESLLSNFEWVYCECSFVELYSGQKLTADVIEWLSVRKFRTKGIYNPLYDHDGQVIQADFLFQRNE